MHHPKGTTLKSSGISGVPTCQVLNRSRDTFDPVASIAHATPELAITLSSQTYLCEHPDGRLMNSVQ